MLHALIGYAQVICKSDIDNLNVQMMTPVTFLIINDRKNSAYIRKVMKEIIYHLFGKEIKVVLVDKRNLNT